MRLRLARAALTERATAQTAAAQKTISAGWLVSLPDMFARP
jgi:hypothetical protein